MTEDVRRNAPGARDRRAPAQTPPGGSAARCVLIAVARGCSIPPSSGARFIAPPDGQRYTPRWPSLRCVTG